MGTFHNAGNATALGLLGTVQTEEGRENHRSSNSGDRMAPPPPAVQPEPWPSPWRRRPTQSPAHRASGACCVGWRLWSRASHRYPLESGEAIARPGPRVSSTNQAVAI